GFMQVTLRTDPLEAIDAEALAIVSFEESPSQQLPAAAGELVKETYDSGEFSGKACESALLHRPTGVAARRVLVVGGGKPDKFTPADMRKAAAYAARTLKSKKVQRIALALPAEKQTADFASAAVEGVILGSFEPNQLKTTDKDEQKPIESLTLVAANGGNDLKKAVEAGRVLAEAQNFTRALANEPPNVLTPTALADRARQMCAASGLEFESLDENRMRELGVGALLGVSQGSAEPPALIIMRYKPAGKSDGKVNLGLV